MGKLFLGKYASLCVVGGEIVYTICMIYGFFLSGSKAALHASLFELLPGWNGMNLMSWVFGAITVALWCGVVGAYVAWMHNVSLEK